MLLSSGCGRVLFAGARSARGRWSVLILRLRHRRVWRCGGIRGRSRGGWVCVSEMGEGRLGGGDVEKEMVSRGYADF